MAGDWIKLRGGIETDPKFIGLFNELVFNKPSGLFYYLFGDENTTKFALENSNETVTNRLLRTVTKPALRDVTKSALHRVWCAANEHCKVVGEDAICQPMRVIDLDEIAGIKGFGEAMKSVGWVLERDDNTLLFPNFCEYNEPACVRKPPKSNSERQREYRERKKEKTPKKERVTRVTKSNAREEKIREEENTKKTPLPPSGEVREKQPFVTVEDLTFPPSLDNPESRAAFGEWLAYKRERRQGYKNPGFASKLLAEFGRDGPEVLRAAVDYSIGRNYQGLVRPESQHAKPERGKSEFDKAIEAARERERNAHNPENFGGHLS